jgi:microcystin-dependent protein
MGGTPPYTYGASARHTHTFTTSWMSAITGAYNHTHSIGADGGSAAHNNLHPFTTCNVFIKY